MSGNDEAVIPQFWGGVSSPQLDSSGQGARGTGSAQGTVGEEYGAPAGVVGL